MNTKRILGAALAALLLVGLPSAELFAQGPAIEMVPSTMQVGPAGTVSVLVRMTGLGAAALPSLGGFDVVLTFDDTLFTFNSIDFGTDLGDPAALEVITSNMAAGGNLTATSVSLLTPAQLVTNQAATVTMFTAVFTAIGTGTGTFNLVPNAPPADEAGAPITIAPIVPVTVESGAMFYIPTLSTTGLLTITMLIGLGGFFVLRRMS